MKTFVKWAGNKTSIISRIVPYLSGDKLIEPFSGSCAVSINTNFETYYCNDINGDLINLLKLAQNDTDVLIHETKKLFLDGNVVDRYYELREKYNQSSNQDERAELFLYLNRHCYNGLCRYNKSGKFNVPFGSYSNPYYPEVEIREFAKKSQRFKFFIGDYKDVFKLACKNTTIYCDPPYCPIEQSSNFSNYTGIDFKMVNHCELKNLCIATVKKNPGCVAIISNHDTVETRQLYNDATKIISFPVKRTISSDSGNRKPVNELLAIYK